MNNIQKRLEDARAELLRRQYVLASLRCRGSIFVPLAEREVCRAIDRAWDAQCMAQGSL